jgi:integrase
MKGTVEKRTYRSGVVSWYYQIDLGKDSSGKRLRHTESGFATKAEAVAARDVFISDKHRNKFVVPSRQTVREYLAEWLTEHADRNLAPKTADRYHELLEKYVMPRIGDILLRDLDPGRLEKLYNELRVNGSIRKEGGSLSPKTVRHIHGAIHAALAKAVRWKRIVTNPAAMCDLPRMQKREVIAPDQIEAQLIFDAALGTPMYMPALIVAYTGMRRGEVLALQWSGIDFENRTLKVNRSLCQVRDEIFYKGTKGNKVRSFPLPEVLIAALQAHRKEQDQNREMFGPDYRSDLDLVICKPDGTEVFPDNFSAAFCKMLRKIGKPGLGIHSIRHSHASILLSKGVSVAAVSKRLGHANISTTLNVYGHSFSRDEMRAAEVVDEVFRPSSRAESKGVQ